MFGNLPIVPNKTYKDVLDLMILSNGGVFVPVFYINGRYEWYRIDKQEYVRQLQDLSNAKEVDFPCFVEHDTTCGDDDVFIHPKVEPANHF